MSLAVERHTPGNQMSHLLLVQDTLFLDNAALRRATGTHNRIESGTAQHAMAAEILTRDSFNSLCTSSRRKKLAQKIRGVHHLS
jgi:hypothetical protein